MESLVAVLSTHNEIGNVDLRFGFWGVADPKDIGNGKRTEAYGLIPLEDPQFQDVMAFIEERCEASHMSGYFTQTGSGQGQEASNLPTLCVYQHPSGRVMTVEAVTLARNPNSLIQRIIAFSGQEPDQLQDQYPGLGVRQERKGGSPVDLNSPDPTMGPRFYKPSSSDDPNKYVPVSGINPTQAQLDKARYTNEKQQTFEVFNRSIGAAWIMGGPPPVFVRRWQMVDW